MRWSVCLIAPILRPTRWYKPGICTHDRDVTLKDCGGSTLGKMSVSKWCCFNSKCCIVGTWTCVSCLRYSSQSYHDLDEWEPSTKCCFNNFCNNLQLHFKLKKTIDVQYNEPCSTVTHLKLIPVEPKPNMNYDFLIVSNSLQIIVNCNYLPIL